MIGRGPLTAALLLCAGGGLLALVESSDPPIATAAGLVALLAAAGASGRLLLDRLQRSPRALPTLGVDPFGGLRGLLRPNSLGRERAIFAVQALEFASGRRPGASWSPAQLREMFGWSAEEFAAWLEGRLAGLERET